jgi:hypothetical protein
MCKKVVISPFLIKPSLHLLGNARLLMFTTDRKSVLKNNGNGKEKSKISNGGISPIKFVFALHRYHRYCLFDMVWRNWFQRLYIS